MDKNQVADLLTKYQQGTATPREKSMVDAYMLLAEKEKAVFFEQEKEEIKERIWHHLAPVAALQQAGGRWSFLRNISSSTSKVAAIWILVLGSLVTGYLLRYQLLDMVDPVAIKTIETSPYEIKQVSMPDGSLVTLAQNSRISFPEHYRGHRRTASLNGTAFFNVTRDATAPFTVQSGDLDVKVLGTSFEVEDAKTGYEASVTVLTGKVQVNCDNRKLAVLESNQQVRYDKFSKQPNVIQQMDAAAKTGWTKKQLVFNETPLAVVVKTLQVYYGMKITILDHVLKADDTFSGSFDRNETRKEVLDVICFSSGLTYSITKDSTIIIRK